MVIGEAPAPIDKEGRYDVAARTFDEANRMYPHVTLTWNAARAYHNGGELPAARDRYRKCLADETLPAEKRVQAVDYLVEVEVEPCLTHKAL